MKLKRHKIWSHKKKAVFFFFSTLQTPCGISYCSRSTSQTVCKDSNKLSLTKTDNHWEEHNIQLKETGRKSSCLFQTQLAGQSYPQRRWRNGHQWNSTGGTALEKDEASITNAAESHPLCLFCSPSSGCWNNSPISSCSQPHGLRELLRERNLICGKCFQTQKNRSSYIWKDQMNWFHTSHKAASTLAFCFRTRVGFWSKSPSHQFTMHWLHLQSCFDAHELDSFKENKTRSSNKNVQQMCSKPRGRHKT